MEAEEQIGGSKKVKVNWNSDRIFTDCIQTNFNDVINYFNFYFLHFTLIIKLSRNVFYFIRWSNRKFSFSYNIIKFSFSKPNNYPLWITYKTEETSQQSCNKTKTLTLPVFYKTILLKETLYASKWKKYNRNNMKTRKKRYLIGLWKEPLKAIEIPICLIVFKFFRSLKRLEKNKKMAKNAFFFVVDCFFYHCLIFANQCIYFIYEIISLKSPYQVDHAYFNIRFQDQNLWKNNL